MDTIVFTNGCFDILHAGHVDLLTRARELGTKLIVGINSDRSVRQIKGAPRPFVGEAARAAVLRALRSVDDVVIFDELTPQRIIEEIEPDVIVKGGDWKPEEIIGSDFVLKRGGKVFSLPLKGDFSTTAIAEKINQEEKTQTGENGTLQDSLREHLTVFERLMASEIDAIERAGEMI